MSYRNKKTNETDNNQYDSLYSPWYNNDLISASGLKFPTSFYDQSNNLDASNLSLKSMSFNSHSNSNFNVHPARNDFQNTPDLDNMGTISLTDMLKTSYSHKGSKNHGDSMISYQKVTGVLHQQSFENFDFNDDDLQAVSNRKLQNRANAKRARERRKGEWQQMKELIQDLKNQNRELKSNIYTSSKKEENSFKKCQKKWNYCKRCRKQFFYDQGHQYSKQGSSIQSQQLSSVSKGKSKLQDEYLRVFGQRKGLRNQQQEEQMMIQEKKDTKINNQNSTGNRQEELDVEFEQFDFVPKQKQKKNKNYSQNQRQRWVGKMWIALSVIMLVIGINMNGLEGSGEKSIRLYQKQARKWVSDFEDQNVSSLKIRMKTKIGNTFIQNEKGSQKQVNKWRQKNKWSQKLQSMQNQDRRNGEGSFWRNNISFQPEEIYTRQLIEQQETEMQIDKDLLFSIHAQLNDIGRYI